MRNLGKFIEQSYKGLSSSFHGTVMYLCQYRCNSYSETLENPHLILRGTARNYETADMLQTPPQSSPHKNTLMAFGETTAASDPYIVPTDKTLERTLISAPS